ncbi:hypothetical protein V8E52_004962 [Russula decolorans]
MQRENHHLFPNTFYTLETWEAEIRRPFSEANQCFLEEVVHYKALSAKEHEFLVVYASHPSGSKIVLGVDRNAQDLATAPSKRTSGSAYPDTDTTQSLLPSSSTSPPELLHLAYDGVQVSHDGTPEPILAQHGPCVRLYTITFSSPPLTARPPSLLHLTVLLRTINTHFRFYDLLQYQCYFFARATCLALMVLFGGVETELEEGKRAATWRGVHTSLYSPGSMAEQDMLLLSAVRAPLILPAGLLGTAVELYVRNVVGQRISDEKIRQHAIPDLYRAAWRSFVL